MQIVASRKGQNYMQHAQRRCLFRLGYGAAPTPPEPNALRDTGKSCSPRKKKCQAGVNVEVVFISANGRFFYDVTKL